MYRFPCVEAADAMAGSNKYAVIASENLRSIMSTAPSRRGSESFPVRLTVSSIAACEAFPRLRPLLHRRSWFRAHTEHVLCTDAGIRRRRHLGRAILTLGRLHQRSDEPRMIN